MGELRAQHRQRTEQRVLFVLALTQINIDHCAECLRRRLILRLTFDHFEEMIEGELISFGNQFALRSEMAVETALRQMTGGITSRIPTEANPFFKIITDAFATMLARVAWVTVLDFFTAIPKKTRIF